jgi:hypothetical protein
MLCLLGCGSSAPTRAHVSRTHGQPQAIFEDELHLRTDPGGTLALLRKLGVQRVRVYVPWSAIAPHATRKPAGFNGADPAAYPALAWAVYDSIVGEAARRGMPLDLTVGGPVPTWAEGSGAPRSRFASWMPDAAEFGAFVRAVATRYSGHYTPPRAPSPLPRISFWSIWNEPNYGVDLAPQAIDESRVEVSPRLYRGLVDVAWSALAATGHRGDTILIGETAPRGITTGDNPGNFSGMVPLRFIRALYCVDSSLSPLSGDAASVRGCPPDAAGSQRFAAQHPGLFQASGFADHPYPQGGSPPNFRTPDEPDYADLASIGNLETTLDRAMAAYGVHTQLPIFSTEFGYQTNPPEKLANLTNPATAAGYLNWSEYLTWRDPRIRSYDQYLLTDPPGANAAGGFATGLEFSSGVKKATYAAYRLPIFLPEATSTGSPIEVWGDVRPAAYVARHARRPVEIQFRPHGSVAFKTVLSVRVTDPHGYFDTLVTFKGSGAVRLAWSDPDGSRIFSRVTDVTVK